MSNELWQLSATEQAQFVASGRASAVEVAAAHLARIDAVNGQLNAIVRRTDEHALAVAQRIDAGSINGSLAGAIATSKINTDHVPFPSDNGIVALKDNPSTNTAMCIQGMEEAGLVFAGRTNSPAFALRFHTGNDLHGQTFNPHNKAATPGGSSGGAAVAVATGMCAVAQGNDVGGSIRFPAFCNGVVGLRPTIGRMVTGGTNPNPRMLGASFMATNGPLARTMTDLRATYAAMCKDNWADSAWVPAPHQFSPPHGPIKVALVVDDGHPMHSATLQAIRTAGQHLQDAGYEVEEIAPPSLSDLFGLWMRMSVLEMSTQFFPMVPHIGDSGLTKAIENWLPYFPEPSPQGMFKAYADRELILRAWNAFFAQFHIVVAPVLTKPYMRANEDLEGVEAFGEIITHSRWLLDLPPLGLPSLAVPVSEHEGMPQGVQLIAHTWREDLLLDAGDAIEQREGVRHVVDPAG
jgi:amidase